MLTITEATKGNAADHGNYFWDVTLDDGRIAWMLAKHDVKQGDEVVVHSEKNGKLRVKRPEKDNSSGGSKDFKADPAKLRSENARSALHAAKDLVVAGKIELSEMGKKTADFYSYISKHSEES